jgi:23S rRNA (uracil1939-C5)-methyltransferase
LEPTVPETIRLHVDSLAHGGAGVGRSPEGEAVFVQSTCPGDVVDAEVTADHGRWAEAVLREVVEPSPDRRKPPCPYFGECGGCQWQHISHEVQAASKRRIVADAFRRIGKLPDLEVLDCVSVGRAYGYRNKIELSVGAAPSGALLLGLMAHNEERLVPIEACLLMPERCRSYPKALTGALRYLSRGTDLGLRRVHIRAATGTSDTEVDLWAHPGPFPRAMVAKTLGAAVRSSTLTRVLAAGEDKARDIRGVEVLSGSGSWREKLGEYQYRVSAPSFFQVNTAGAEALVSLVTEALQPDGTDRVLDLYSGVGTFTLPLAEHSGEVVAVEHNGHAIRDLRENLDANGVYADVAPGDAARALADLGRFDMAVVDPPRSGIRPDALKALVATGARRVVYVSCDPATLARDAAAMTAAGYDAVRATPVDMFPQTYHVETVAVFDRAKG